MMKNDKLLTIAIPTYNRAPFLKVGLEKIIKEIEGFEDQIELLISDNCSPDQTREVIEGFLSQGICLKYNRNIENLGMDGNFVYCLKNATAKYVWILGDDDYLIEGTISKLLNLMSSGKYGLIHLSNNVTCDLKHREFSDKVKFIGDISFWITFISANIVRTKYVQKIDFDKYLGTYFTPIPVYLTAAIEEEVNLMVYFKTMDIAVDAKTNGGYNIFEVFVTNYLNIIKKFKVSLGIRWYEVEKYRLFRWFLWGWIVQLLINSNHGLSFKTENWFKIILKKYWYEPYLYPMLFLFLIKKLKN